MLERLGAIWETITGKEGGNNHLHHPLNGISSSSISSSSIILQMGFEPRSDDDEYDNDYDDDDYDGDYSSSQGEEEEQVPPLDPLKEEERRFARRAEFTKLCITYIERFFGRPLTYDSDFLCNMIQDQETQGWMIPDHHPIFLMLSTSRSIRPLRLLTANDLRYFVYDELAVRQAITKTRELFADTQPLVVLVETGVFKLEQQGMLNTKIE